MSASGIGARTLSRGFLALVILITLVVAFQQHHNVVGKLADPRGGHINDFDRWMLMTPHFVHDHADYVNDYLPTAPLTLIVFAPLAALSRPNAQIVWVCTKLAFAYLAFALASGIVARAGVRLTTSATALIIAGWWLPVIVDMQEGQTNFLAFLPLVAGLYEAQRETRGSQTVAGLLIGLAVAAKVTPVIFVAYFLWKRRWALALASIVGVGVWLFFVPAAVFGWQQNLRWLDQWARIMLVPYVAQAKVVYATTQSFGSFALRLLTQVPAFESNRDGVVTGHQMNVLALAEGVVGQLVRVVLMAVAAAGLWWMRRPLPTFRCPRYVVEIGCVAAFMLWFSERTWVHHYVSFLLTLCAAGMILSRHAEPDSERRSVRSAMILFAVTTFFASEAGHVFGRDGVDWVKALGVFLWPSVVVTLAVARHAIARECAPLSRPL